MVRMVIDTDPGVDDAQALMLAAAHPEARLEAVTTVAGNVSLQHTTANACKILDLLGLPVPVFAGCARGLLHAMPYATEVHGEDGLGDAGLEPSSRPVQQEHAAQALIRLANQAPGELTLVALGPLTNIALATRLDPELPQKYRRLVVMGGAVRALGNTDHPSAEFNVYCDPEAAHIVFGAWPQIELVPWETVVTHSLGEEFVNQLLAIASPRAQFFRRISGKTLAFLRARLGELRLFLADGLALAVALEPDIVRQREARALRVELAGSHCRGQTTVDWYGITGASPHVHIVLEVDHTRWQELVCQSLM